MPSSRHPDLEGRSVLITGGGSGIGAALVEAFVAQGSRVAFIDIAADESRDLAGRIERREGRRPLFIHADITDIAALQGAVADAAAAHGPVTVLVNNAARDDRTPVEGYSVDDWDANHAVNLRPHFFTAQAVMSGMKAVGGGSIINFSSIAYMLNGGEFPAYAAAKAGVVGLTKNLAGALGPFGIRVNAVAPGWVLTERQRRLWVTEEKLSAHIDRQCLKREMVVEDMVGPCLFLASDASAMMTAQTMIVDGGVM